MGTNDRTRASWRVTYWLLLLVLTTAAVVGCEEDESMPPEGVELSPVEGVSIVRGRRPKRDLPATRDTSAVQSQFETERSRLVDAFARAVRQGEDYVPVVIQRASLPKGEYTVRAWVRQGGEHRLVEMLADAYTAAFPVQVRYRTVEAPVYVLSLSDRRPRRFYASDEGLPRGIRHEFTKSGGESMMVEHFVTTMEGLAWYAGYVSRNGLFNAPGGRRDAILATHFVDETGLDGVYRGELPVNLDPQRRQASVRQSLRELGLDVSRETRPVEAWVIDPDPQGSAERASDGGG